MATTQNREEAVVVLDPDVVQQGRKQSELAIINEQGFVILHQKTFQMSQGQAERFGGNPIRFAKGPCCALIVQRHDDQSPYDCLRELGLETIYFTESPYESLRARMSLFPEPKQFERTFAIASGDKAVALLDEITTRDGYLVTLREQRPLSGAEAAALDVDLSFEQKTLFVLDKYGAIYDLQLAIGPPPSGIVVSSSVAKAQNAIRLLWPDGFPQTRTLGLIKPDAVRRGDHIVMRQRIVEAGFTIITEKIIQLSADRARIFYEEHQGRPFYEPLVEFMSSGPLVALALSRPNAVAAWRTFLGPTNSNTARQTAPLSLRAIYGTDGQKNAAHGSSSAGAAARELSFFFPGLLPDNINLSLGAVSAFIMDKPDFRQQHGASLNQILVDALTYLCQTKPVGLAAVAELGIWLRDHNPHKPKIIVPQGSEGISKTYKSSQGTVTSF